MSDAQYLREHGLEQALRQAVARVLREQPQDPVTGIGRMLLEAGGLASLWRGPWANAA